jgi:hypothetical protein
VCLYTGLHLIKILRRFNVTYKSAMQSSLEVIRYRNNIIFNICTESVHDRPANKRSARKIWLAATALDNEKGIKIKNVQVSSDEVLDGYRKQNSK